ncbi:MAG: hypothetical protein NVS9B8_16000 [Candidatus Limnocylindrales bacterium]
MAQLGLWDDSDEDAGTPGNPLPRHLVDEVATVVAWLEARAARVRVIDCDAGLAWPSTRLRTFEPRTSRQPGGSGAVLPREPGGSGAVLLR